LLCGKHLTAIGVLVRWPATSARIGACSRDMRDRAVELKGKIRHSDTCRLGHFTGRACPGPSTRPLPGRRTAALDMMSHD
jgi:hypothetical protein